MLLGSGEWIIGLIWLSLTDGVNSVCFHVFLFISKDIYLAIYEEIISDFKEIILAYPAYLKKNKKDT